MGTWAMTTRVVKMLVFCNMSSLKSWTSLAWIQLTTLGQWLKKIITGFESPICLSVCLSIYLFPPLCVYSMCVGSRRQWIGGGKLKGFVFYFLSAWDLFLIMTCKESKWLYKLLSLSHDRWAMIHKLTGVRASDLQLRLSDWSKSLPVHIWIKRRTRTQNSQINLKHK